MSDGVNHVMFGGHLGADPQLRYTAGKTAVCSFSIAASRKWRDDQGERREETEWGRCVAWGKTGEVAAEYLRKGMYALVEGRMQTRKWQGKDGMDRYTTEINVEKLHLFEFRPKDDDVRETREQRPERAPRREGPANDSDLDDLPF
jgi:single-strand DNA-binding protein